MDKVIVETTATLKEVAEAVGKNGNKVAMEGADMVVYVSDSRDAEEEVTDLLSEAGINAFVYLENKWTF